MVSAERETVTEKPVRACRTALVASSVTTIAAS